MRLRDLPTNTVLDTVAFLVTCFHRSRHYSYLLDTTALTKLLLRKISPKLIIMQKYGKFKKIFPAWCKLGSADVAYIKLSLPDVLTRATV